MGKIKNKRAGSPPKISGNAVREVLSENYEMPNISFRYLTPKKNYNFEKMDKGKQKEWKAALLDRLMEITQTNWKHWHELSRTQNGIETLYASELHFSPNDYDFTEDEKVIVFRFHSDKGRIIGIKKNATFYIIGLDTDFSAYNHGS